MLIQIMSGKICLRSIGKTLLSTNFWKQKVCWHHPACFALLPQVNFPYNNLNYQWSWRWWDWTQAIFLNLFYLNISDAKNNNIPRKSNLRSSNGLTRSLSIDPSVTWHDHASQLHQGKWRSVCMCAQNYISQLL